MSKSIVGIAKSTSQVEVTLDDLQNNALVPSSDISVFDDGILKHTGAGGLSRRSKLRKGAVTGGAIGGIVGPLAGSDTLAIPGRGPFFAAGSIVAALSCAAEGATAGGSVGALVGLGIPEYEAKACEEQIAFLRAPKADQTEKGPQKRSRDARLHPFTLTITPFEHSL